MARFWCAKCDLVAYLKRIDAKAHGWTVKDHPIGQEIEEIWTCPKCNARKAQAA